MRLITILTFMLVSSTLLAQRITGVVVDRVTRLPIAFANVTSGYNSYYTDRYGKFTINLRLAKDTALITFLGYKPYHLVIDAKALTDTLHVYLEQISIMLKSVSVGASRNFKMDSLRNRRLFSSVYNYKATGIKELFTQKASLVYKPDNYINAPNSTTSLVGVDVLSVIKMFGKGNKNISRLQKAMFKDEESSFVDRTFSKQKVASITALKGDSLQNFILKYRPSITQIKRMTNYELIMYIKKSYNQYISAR